MLTSKESDKIVELRSILKDKSFDGHADDSLYLIRWLRASDMNVGMAEEMLRKSIQWRKEENVDSILEDWHPPELVFRIVAVQHCGFDKSGNGVYFVVADLTEFKEAMRMSNCDIKKTSLYVLETVENSTKSLQNNALAQSTRQGTFILDLSKVSTWGLLQSLSPRCWELAVELTKIINANYPELQKHIIIINAPRIFTFLFDLAKHLLPTRTIAKIKIYGYNKAEWRQCLLSEIDEDQLIPEYGGTNLDIPQPLFPSSD